MELKLREKLLVEKCLNSIIKDYKRRDDINALIDLKLDFLSFLSSNLPEEIEYGIEYIRLQYEDIYITLGSMILEYTTNKLDGALECKPIGIESISVPLEIKYTIWDKIKHWFGSLFKEEQPKPAEIWPEENRKHLEKTLNKEN